MEVSEELKARIKLELKRQEAVQKSRAFTIRLSDPAKYCARYELGTKADISNDSLLVKKHWAKFSR